ncbi:MAG: class I SAM-dependent methyltransferase [Bryobacteraceae bacterium]
MANAAIAEQQQYYTNRWKRFEKANALELARAAKILDYMSRVELPRDAAICDLGCGAGWLTNILNTFGNATGVDLSQVDAARMRYPGCTFETIDIPNWKREGNAFDLVTSSEVIEHIEPKAQPGYLEVAHRILRPGGYLILTTPNASTVKAAGGRAYSNQPLEFWLRAAELRNLVGRQFEILAFDSIILNAGNTGLHRIVNSHTLRSSLGKLGLLRSWELLAGKLSFGLHLTLLARKK